MPSISFQADTNDELQRMIRAYWYGTPEGQNDLIMVGRYQIMLKNGAAMPASPAEAAVVAGAAAVVEDAPAEAPSKPARPTSSGGKKRGRPRKTAADVVAEDDDATDAEDADDSDAEDDAVAEPTEEQPAITPDYMRAVLGALTEIVPGPVAMGPLSRHSEPPAKNRISGVPENKRAEFIKDCFSVVPAEKRDAFNAAMAKAGYAQ